MSFDIEEPLVERRATLELAVDPKIAFVLACFADRRICHLEVAKVSGYSTRTLRWLIGVLGQADLVSKQPRKVSRTVDDVYQALLICAERISSRTLRDKKFSLLVRKSKQCETGLCDDAMRAAQIVFDDRRASPIEIAVALGKSRHWYYVNKQEALCGCQTPAKCKNWSDIANAFDSSYRRER